MLYFQDTDWFYQINLRNGSQLTEWRKYKLSQRYSKGTVDVITSDPPLKKRHMPDKQWYPMIDWLTFLSPMNLKRTTRLGMIHYDTNENFIWSIMWKTNVVFPAWKLFNSDIPTLSSYRVNWNNAYWPLKYDKQWV